MEREGTFYSSFDWHPLSVQAALANLRSIRKHKTQLLANVAAMSDYFHTRLSQIKFQSAPAIRIQGLAIALQFKKPRAVSQLLEKTQKRRLLLTNTGDSTLLILPALNIDRKTARKGLDILASCA